MHKASALCGFRFLSYLSEVEEVALSTDIIVKVAVAM